MALEGRIGRGHDRCTDISQPLPWSTECVLALPTDIAAPGWHMCIGVEYRQAVNGQMFTERLEAAKESLSEMAGLPEASFSRSRMHRQTRAYKLWMMCAIQ